MYDILFIIGLVLFCISLLIVLNIGGKSKRLSLSLEQDKGIAVTKEPIDKESLEDFIYRHLDLNLFKDAAIYEDIELKNEVTKKVSSSLYLEVRNFFYKTNLVETKTEFYKLLYKTHFTEELKIELSDLDKNPRDNDYIESLYLLYHFFLIANKKVEKEIANSPFLEEDEITITEGDLEYQYKVFNGNLLSCYVGRIEECPV